MGMGGKGGGEQQVTDYYMSLHLGVCADQADAITGIYVNQKTAWEGEVTSQEDIAINKPYLFGGNKSGGGLFGGAYVLPGNSTQVLPDYLAQKLGSPNGASAPGFRGLTSIFFHGGGLLTSAGSQFASSVYAAGFYWTSNSPVVAQNLDVRVRRMPKGLDQSLARIPAATNQGFIASNGSSTEESATNAAASINASSQYFTATAAGNVVTITERVTGNAWGNGVTPVADDNQPYRASVVVSSTGTDYLYYFSISSFSTNPPPGQAAGTGTSAHLTFERVPETGMTFSIGPETYTFSSFAGDDANPAHIIYEVLTNNDWGMGYTSDLIDVTSFMAAAQTLYNEQLGLSMIWSQQSTIEDFVNDVLSHILGVLFINPSTGLLTLKLLRGDYDIASLPVFNPDNATMSNFQRKLWGETANEIVVTWTNPVTEEAETITIQSGGNIAIQGGVVSDSRNFYGCRNAALATRLGARELRAVCAPLCSMDMDVDRSAWNRVPGDVVVVNWPENNLYDTVMRIGRISYGNPEEPSIKVSLTQDIWSLDLPIVTSPPDSLWTDPAKAPAELTDYFIFTLPYFFSTTNEIGGVQTLTYPQVEAAVVAYAADRNVTGFDLFGQRTDASGNTSWMDFGTKTIVEMGLSPALAAEATSTIPVACFTHGDRAPVVGGFILIQTPDGTQEMALVTASDGTNYTVNRGVLDTVPRAWPAGSKMWAINSGLSNVDEVEIRSAGETVSYKLCERTSLGMYSPDLATVRSAPLSGRPHLPLRPANVRVNGVGFGSVAIGSSTNVHITWATRNRTLEQGQALAWTAGNVAPEYFQETVVTVFDQSGNQVYQQGSLWTEDELTLPASYFARYTSIKVVVSSRLNGLLDSLQGHAITVTGLPGNTSASPPPAPPAVTTPPSPIAAPTAANWTVSGGIVTSGNGDSIPAITVTGSPDSASDEAVIVRYKKTADSIWTIASPISLSGGSIATKITGLSPSTAYNVQLAYETTYNGGLLLSEWLTPTQSPVTTGAFVAGDTVKVGGTPASALLTAVSTANNTASAALTAANSAQSAAEDAASNLAAEITRAQAAEGTLTTSIANLAATVGGNTSAISSEAIARANGDTALAASITSLTSTVNSNTASITSQSATLVTLTSSTASIQQQLSAGKPNLLKNGSGELGFAYWGGVAGTWGVETNAWGAFFICHPNASGGYFADSDPIPVWGDNPYTCAANSDIGQSGGATDGFTRLELCWFANLTDAQNNTNRIRLDQGPNVNRPWFGDPDNRAASKMSVTAPSNAGYVRVRIVGYGTNMQYVAFGAIKFEHGSIATPYTQEASLNQTYITQQTDSASFAASISTLSAGYGSLSATVSSVSSATATLSGQVYGTYGLTVNAAGAIAGMTLYASGGAAPVSSVVFDANSFIIKDSSHPNITPFYYDATTGTLFLNSITVNTGNVANNAITSITSAYSTSVNTWFDGGAHQIASATMTTTGAIISLIGSVCASAFLGSDGSPVVLRVSIKRNGTTLQTFDTATVTSGAPSVDGFYLYSNIPITLNDIPTAGSNTYTVWVQATLPMWSTGGTPVLSVSFSAIELKEFKK